MNQEGPYIFHAADVSYFSGKVRPALPHKSLWYREVIPDYEQIRERTGMTFIPVLMTPEGEGWQDTSTILDRLEERHPDPPLFPKTPVQKIVAAVSTIEDWADEHADDGTPPRAIGLAEAQYRDVTLRCGARPYTLWMLQRTLDAYRALSDAERAQVDSVISGTGWEAILALAPRHRLTKRGNELAWKKDGEST